MFEGTVEGLRASATLTGRHLDDRAALKPSVRTPAGALEVRGATTHNLRDVDVDIPLGVLVVVTGVAGSGKSSLIHGSVAGRDGVVAIDQGAIRGSRRSNPATYTGLLDPIRTAFAKANGVKPALFSANSEGACPNCNGAGVIYTDLGDDGRGRHGLRGLRGASGSRRRSSTTTSAAATSARSSRCPVTEAEAFFGSGEARTPAAHAILRRLVDVGLGYLSLGQPLTDPVRRRAPATQAGDPHRREGRDLPARRADEPDSTSPTSSSCSACSTGSSTPARRSSSSSTTRP